MGFKTFEKAITHGEMMREHDSDHAKYWEGYLDALRKRHFGDGFKTDNINKNDPDYKAGYKAGMEEIITEKQGSGSH